MLAVASFGAELTASCGVDRGRLHSVVDVFVWSGAFSTTSAIETGIAHASWRVSSCLSTVEARVALFTLSNVRETSYVTVGALRARFWVVVGMIGVGNVSCQAVEACRARHGPDRGTKAVGSSWTLQASVHSLLVLIGARRTRLLELVARAFGALVTGSTHVH